ncbi:glycoside hydrolase family 3 protein, partial [Streptomyces sp. SID8455]|nr:glycoside hydrolase family 3 protein [Streptomyces sp. SID8455]
MHHRSPGTSRRAVLAAGAGAAAAATVSTSASAAVGAQGAANAVTPAARRPSRKQLRAMLSRMSLE